MRITGLISAVLCSAALVACAPSERPDQTTTSQVSSPKPKALRAPVSATASTLPVRVTARTTSSVASPTVAPSDIATASPQVTITPMAASPKPTFSASIAPTPTASATPTPFAPAEWSAPDAPPQIVNVAINKTTVHGGELVSGEVVTSLNVASVEVTVAGFTMAMAKTGPGHFALAYTVPKLPFIFRRTYTMSVLAHNTRGDTTSTSLPITVR